jgi:hypothetical protein
VRNLLRHSETSYIINKKVKQLLVSVYNPFKEMCIKSSYFVKRGKVIISNVFKPPLCEAERACPALAGGFRGEFMNNKKIKSVFKCPKF